MSIQLALEVPTLVREMRVNEQRYYRLRPLFVNHPVVMHMRYEKGLAQYKRAIKQFFQDFEFGRSTADELLWYTFRPELKYELFDIAFNFSGKYLQGKIGAAVFEKNGLTFIVLPELRNYMFMAKVNDGKTTDFQPKVQAVVKQLFKHFEKEEGKDFEADAYFSTRKEFVTHIPAKIRINYSKFKFEQAATNFFFFQQNQDFDGASELEKVGQNLVHLYPTELKKAFLREKIISQLTPILFGRRVNVPFVIVGKTGSGKHSIIHELQTRHIEDNKKGRKREIWQVDPNRVIAGMSIVGMWQKRFEAMLQHLLEPVEKAKQSDILLVDNPVSLLRIGKSSQNDMTLSDVLKPYLEERSIQTVLLATPEEWKIVQEKDRRFADLFQVMRLQEPDMNTVVQMVLHQRRELEIANDCVISTQVIPQLFDIQRNYIRSEALPGGVMKLLTQLATKYKGNVIDLPEVREEFKELSGLEEHIFDKDITLEENEVQDALKQHLVGQPQAIEALSSAVQIIKSKLNNADKPLSSYLFIGPTGVGKTQAAKALCRYLLGDDKHMLRFDMNEYIDASAVQRLIGDYYNPEGQLTGKVRYQSFGVLLLDEIEKAHPNVHDLLLQVLDDGRLTDSLGRVVDFSNMIIIMTSNVGADAINRSISIREDAQNQAAIYQKALERTFRPEFINRIDKTVIFNPLDLKYILGIARLQIKELLQRDGFVRRRTILNVSQETLRWVAERGYDPKMGGRALKRQIEKDLTALSANQLIKIQTDNPILFNISFNKKTNRIEPTIQPLHFEVALEEEWMPNAIYKQNAGAFFREMLKEMEQIERTVKRRPTDKIDAKKDWQYYQFTNAIDELKDELTQARLRMGEQVQARTQPFRFKRVEMPSKAELSEDLIYFIRDNYKHASPLFDRTQSEQLIFFLKVLHLKLASADFKAGHSGKIKIHFESYIDGLGKEHIQYLITQYSNVLKTMDANFEMDEKQLHIEAEGFALPRLFQAEAGIHLFQDAANTPIPIRVHIDGATSGDSANGIIRIYDREDTVTDLRLACTVVKNCSEMEQWLFLLAGL